MAQRRPLQSASGCAALALLASLASCRPSGGAADAGVLSCSTTTRCDGTAVRLCRDGRAAEIIEECAPERACSRGRCTSTACARAEVNALSILGCSFYSLDLDNIDADDALGTSVLVTNPNQQVTHVALEHRVDGAWQVVASVDVAPMRSARLVLSESHLEGGGTAVARATRVTSDLPVSAAHFQSDDGGLGGVSSSGATMLLPAHVLGLRYRASSYKEEVTPRLQEKELPGSHNGAGQIVIVATADRTMVTVTPSTTATFEVMGADGGMASSSPMELVLDEGDYAQLYGTTEGSNLSGTEISATRPIAVFSGNISTTYGLIATGVSSPDLTHEQLLPVRAWGRAFVGVVMPPQPGVCDPLLSPTGSSKLSIVADRGGTDVSIRYPAAPDVQKTQLPRGGWVEDTTPQSFGLTANNPIQAMQGLDCEPTMSSAVPTEILHNDLYFGVLPGFDTMIGLVRRQGKAIFLDGARLEESLFDPVGGGFEVARVPMDACPAAASACTHHVQGEIPYEKPGIFGITMRGMDVLAAWALTIPTWNQSPCSDPDDTNCL